MHTSQQANHTFGPRNVFWGHDDGGGTTGLAPSESPSLGPSSPSDRLRKFRIWSWDRPVASLSPTTLSNFRFGRRSVSHPGLLELKVLIRRRRPSGFPPLLPRQKPLCGFLIERPISGNCFWYVEGVHTSEVVQHRLLCPPQFSPTLSSIFGCLTGTFQAWRFDSPPPPPIVARHSLFFFTVVVITNLPSPPLPSSPTRI